MKFKKGFVFGKFMPLHAGHIYLIETALKQVEELTILVCSLANEPIPGYFRYAWMQKTFPQVRVLHVTDENPQEPHEHPDFWNIWVNTLTRNLPTDTEVIFSSEFYGDKLAELMQIKHVMVDQPRELYPISARKIREAPYENWQFIPTVVRPYFIKKVVLVGPESTGKTVLAEKLAAHYQTTWVEEYGKYYVQKYGLKIEPLDIAQIAGGQLLWEEQAALKANKLLICDTDLIVTQIWGEIYCQEAPTWGYQQNHLQKYDLFLLMDIDINWVNDGTREFPELRQWHFERLKQELISRNLPYEIIRGNYEERLQQAIEVINQLFLN